jgi:MFS family permease
MLRGSKGHGLDSWLVAICAARVLLYANFMVYAACLPVVLVEWRMSAAQAGSVASGFTLGYAVSLVVFSWLADHHGARHMVIVSGLLSAVSAIIFGTFAHSYGSALVLYTLAGLSQGGVYTPLIMLFADRYDPARRGAAVGWLIASTSVGYALSLVASGAALALGGYRLAFIVTGLLPASGAALLWLALRTTPNRIHPRAGGLRLRGILRTNANARRLIAGYTAHSWELLGMWAWIPAFLAASAALSGAAAGAAASSGAYLSAVMHLTGAIAASTMGRLSDRVGRRAVLLALAAMSAVLSMTIGWLVAWPIYLLLVLGLLYGFSALGDSPVLSVAITEVVDPGHLGAVLALRALLGFGAGAISPLAFGAVLDFFSPGSAAPTMWGFAFMSLGLGGLLAAVCAWSVRLCRAREARPLPDHT